MPGVWLCITAATAGIAVKSLQGPPVSQTLGRAQRTHQLILVATQRRLLFPRFTDEENGAWKVWERVQSYVINQRQDPDPGVSEVKA